MDNNNNIWKSLCTSFLTGFFLIDIDVCCLHESCTLKTTANEVIRNVRILGCTEPYICLHQSRNGWAGRVIVEKNLEFSWKENEQSSPMWKTTAIAISSWKCVPPTAGAGPGSAVGSRHKQGAACSFHLYLFGFSLAFGDKVTFFTLFHYVEKAVTFYGRFIAIRIIF